MLPPYYLRKTLTNSLKSQTLPLPPPLQSKCRFIPVPVSPICTAPEGIHKSSQTSHRATEDHRGQTSDLHGQYATDSTADLVSPGESGVYNQQRKICVNPSPTNKVPRNDGEFKIHGIKIPRSEDKEDQN